MTAQQIEGKEKTTIEFVNMLTGVPFDVAMEIASYIDSLLVQEKKKEAIAFHIWVRERGYIRRKGLYYSRYVKGVTLTDEGLYNLYLQYVNQSK